MSLEKLLYKENQPLSVSSHVYDDGKKPHDEETYVYKNMKRFNLHERVRSLGAGWP